METEKENVFEPMPGTSAETQNTVFPATAGEQTATELAAARKNMIAGLLWCVGGLAFTFLTYYFAKEGGRYVIATGAVIWGFLQACKGLFTWLKINYENGRYTAFWRMAAAAVCVVCALGWFTMRSMQLEQRSEVKLLDSEQTYVCDDLNLRLTIPAGFEAYAEYHTPETDSTYAFYTITTYDQTWAYHVEGLAGVFGREGGIGDIAEYSSRQASDLYDGGIIARPEAVVIGGHEMYRSEGRKSDMEGYIYSHYNIRHEQALISITFAYPEAEYGKDATRKRIEKLIGGIDFDSPEMAAE